MDSQQNKVLVSLSLSITVLIVAIIFQFAMLIRLETRTNENKESLARLIWLLDLSGQFDDVLTLEEPEQETVSFEQFENNYLTAEVPESWNILIIADTTQVQGVSELSIVNDKNEQLFTLTQAAGLPNQRYCSSLYEFNDTPTEYLQQRTNENKALSDSGTQLVPTLQPEVIPVKSYETVSIFNSQLRRFSNKLFTDTDSTTRGFESACEGDFALRVITLPEISYEIDGVEDSVFFYRYNAALNPTDLFILDQVLESLEISSVE